MPGCGVGVGVASGALEQTTAGSIRVEVYAGSTSSRPTLTNTMSPSVSGPESVTRAVAAASQVPTSGSSALLVNAPAYWSIAPAPCVAVNDVPPTHAPAIAGVPS